MALLLETDLGDLVIDLDVKGSPLLTRNFLKLAKARFFTKCLIYSITPNRFCDSGCPTGDGTGGTSIFGLLDSPGDYRKSNKRFLKSVGRVLTREECQQKGRVVACLTRGVPDTVGSQFRITTAEGPDAALDGYEANDGQEDSVNQSISLGVVVEDESGVLDKINEAYLDGDGRPFADIRILRALVVHDPFEDPTGMNEYLLKNGIVVDESDRVIDSPSPQRPAEEAVKSRISIKDVQGFDTEEDEQRLRLREEETQRKEDRSRAVVLEMLGDLPDAEIKAPENVLFICKLNPATQDDDLELIFSRFDPSVKVEIIRDHDTGDSLQYAFAEFKTKEQAEEAYFKMDNALVDDRRIKVDFSQSVSKVWDKYNQRARMPRGGHGGTFPADRRPKKDASRNNGLAVPSHERRVPRNPGNHREHDRRRDREKQRFDSFHEDRNRGHNPDARSRHHSARNGDDRHERYHSRDRSEEYRRRRLDSRRDRESPDRRYHDHERHDEFQRDRKRSRHDDDRHGERRRDEHVSRTNREDRHRRDRHRRHDKYEGDDSHRRRKHHADNEDSPRSSRRRGDHKDHKRKRDKHSQKDRHRKRSRDRSSSE